MQANVYLVIQGVQPKYGSDRDTRRELGTVRVNKNKPHTARDEIAIRLVLDIPDALFFSPSLEARVTVPGLQCQGPEITAEVADNIAEAIRKQTGLTVHLSATDDGEG